MRPPVLAFCVAFAVLPMCGAAHAQSTSAASPVTPFSAAKPGTAPPQGWSPVKINEQKKPTVYEFVDDQGATVLHATAEAAASLLGYKTTFDLDSAPILHWRWKISRLIESANNTVASKEDSPVRIVLEFEGDKSRLSLSDRSTIAAGRVLSGRELPYATLMYIWSNKEPVGKVVANPRSARVQMVVASSGAGGVGAWQTLSRSVVDDFKKAFNEDPGKLTGVAVLTDTDNTGESVEAWYGDISFRAK
ncbi:MAG: DUF3047 domain-containing protein [Casimicrobiaceae bacterium]